MIRMDKRQVHIKILTAQLHNTTGMEVKQELSNKLLLAIIPMINTVQKLVHTKLTVMQQLNMIDMVQRSEHIKLIPTALLLPMINMGRKQEVSKGILLAE